VQENPLLTACEKSGYADIVTDYYRVTRPVVPVGEIVKFQLREMEDEISYINNLELITVDHPDGTKIACSVDGKISIYGSTEAPISVIDQDGVDHLADVVAEDGKFFTSTGPGFLIVTFRNTGIDPGAINFVSMPKNNCRITDPYSIEKPLVDAGQFPEKQPYCKVEFLDIAGNWVENQILPTRERPEPLTVAGMAGTSSSDTILTMRLTWANSYSTDVICRLIPSTEQFQQHVWRIAKYTVGGKKSVNGDLANAENHTLVLKKGDIAEFDFVAPQSEDAKTLRDYIIRAVGRYQPDYTTHAGLLPTTYQLFGNYPNPFNPTTKISYDLPTSSHVSVEVFNVLGQLVRKLVDDQQNVGHYEIFWDGTDGNGTTVASGIYLYRLKAGEFTDTKKMMLMK